MPKLTDIQAVLLSTAAQRDKDSLYPLPDQLSDGARLTKALAGLLRAGFAEERGTTVESEVYRAEGDTRMGLYATPAGLLAIGIDDCATATANVEPQLARSAPDRATKAGSVLALLQRKCGATLHELVDATGWLPHTTRAALTGLRKKGHKIERTKRDGDTCYSVASAE
jgi:hypothetical protein